MSDFVPVWWENNDEHASFVQMRSCRDAYRRLGEAIFRVVPLEPDASAIDIGCGVGDSTKRLAELGWDIYGAEHSQIARDMCAVMSFPIDLTDPKTRAADFDVVICTETAEHLPEEYADNIVNIVSGAQKWIVFSAAQPGQEWPGHVNLQPIAYWLAKFEAKGWALDVERTASLRHIMLFTHAQHEFCRDNFCVLRRSA